MILKSLSALEAVAAAERAEGLMRPVAPLHSELMHKNRPETIFLCMIFRFTSFNFQSSLVKLCLPSKELVSSSLNKTVFSIMLVDTLRTNMLGVVGLLMNWNGRISEVRSEGEIVVTPTNSILLHKQTTPTKHIGLKFGLGCLILLKVSKIYSYAWCPAVPSRNNMSKLVSSLGKILGLSHCSVQDSSGMSILLSCGTKQFCPVGNPSLECMLF